MARTFTTASSEYVGFTPRAWDAWSGITIACMMRRNATGVYHTLYYSGPNGGFVDGQIQLGLNTSDDVYFGIGAASRTLATTIGAANYCIGATKATGTSTPVCRFAAAPFTSWTNSNMSGTLADPTTTAQTLEEIGRWNGIGDYFGGDMEWLGIWNFAMSQAEFQSLPFIHPSLLANVFPGCQRFYWFNQPITDTVKDLSNHLADQTARTGTTHTVNVALNPNLGGAHRGLIVPGGVA